MVVDIKYNQWINAKQWGKKAPYVTSLMWPELNIKEETHARHNFATFGGQQASLLWTFFPLLCSFTTAMDLLTFLGGSVSLKNRSSSKILLFSFFPEVFFVECLLPNIMQQGRRRCRRVWKDTAYNTRNIRPQRWCQ